MRTVVMTSGFICCSCIVQSQGPATGRGMTRYNGAPVDDRASGAATASSAADTRPAATGVDERVVPPANGYITMPDVFGGTRAQAEDKLHRAGLLGDIEYDRSQCEDSVVHGRVMERGMVCYQTPVPGTKQRDHYPVTLVVQTDDPWHGNVGKVTEWRLMPKLKGLTLEAARAEMKRVGFTSEDNVTLEYTDDPTCAPNIVCVTYPPEMSRAGVHSSKTIRAGTPLGGGSTTVPAGPGDPSAPTPPASQATTPTPPAPPPPQPFF